MSRNRAPRDNLANFFVARALCLVAMLSVSGIAPAAEHAAGANYSLKLEYEMSRQGGAQTSAEQLSPAVLFGITDLNDRATAADNRVRAVEQDNQKWKAELSARENLISELEQAVQLQDQTIKLLENNILQPPQPVIRLPQAKIRTWGPAGWDPRELRWDDVRNFARSPTAAERALTVAVMLLLIFALYLLRRSRNNLQKLDSEREKPQERHGTRSPSARREEVGPRPIAAEQPMLESVDNNLDISAPLPPLEFEQTPPGPRPESMKPQETAPPTVRLAPGDLTQGSTPSPDASMHQSNQPPASLSPSPSPSPSHPRRERADPATLREVDALIAFEHFDDAAEVLAQAMLDNPDNPEYRLRSVYILTALGDHERASNEQASLRAIMDGPMSDTLGRVIETGRRLLPDDPLFESKDSTSPTIPQPPQHSDEAIFLDDDPIDEFNELTFRSDYIEPDDEPPKTD